MKFSLSSLRERFSSPLIHYEPCKPQIEPQEKVVPVKAINIFESVKKEDSSEIETQLLSKVTHQDHSSHVILKFGFCCEKPNTKLLATNHTTQLFDCCKDQCPRKLIKTRIGEWN